MSSSSATRGFSLKRTRVIEQYDKNKEQKQERETKKPKSKKDRSFDHLKPVPDYLCDDASILFCGINPGCRSSERQAHFAHPSNSFWKCLHQSGITNRLLEPTQDITLPEQYNIGITNLVERPSGSAADLNTSEMKAGVPVLLEKIYKTRPKLLVFVGMGMFKVFGQSLFKYKNDDKNTIYVEQQDPEDETTATFSTNVKCGLQRMVLKLDYGNEKTFTTLCYSVPSTSGLVTHYKMDKKVEFFQQVKEISDKLKQGLQVDELPKSSVNFVLSYKN